VAVCDGYHTQCIIVLSSGLIVLRLAVANG
jgi:hypothetical protein